MKLEFLSLKNLERLPLEKRIGSGFLLITSLVLLCGLAGGLGILAIDSSLRTMTGPAWKTANGSTKGALSVRTQMLAAANVLSGVEVNRNLEAIEAARAVAQTAFAEIRDAALLDVRLLSDLDDETLRYDNQLSSVLDARAHFETVAKRFAAATHQMVKIGSKLEEIGDSQIEEIELSPDTPHTWNSGLAEKWAAADGGMEANIGFLTRVYLLKQLVTGAESEQFNQELQAAREFQMEAAEQMLGTGYYDKPVGQEDFNGEFINLTFSKLYRSQLAILDQTIDEYIAAYRAMDAAKNRYNVASENYLTFLVQLEQTSNHAVASLSSLVIRNKVIAGLAILLPIVGSIFVATWAARRCTSSVTKPIDASVTRLKETTQTASAAVAQMSTTINNIAGNTERAAIASRGAAVVADRGRASVAGLGNAADHINGVVELIESVAAKTNLLALNATIEAARAGETGKGFAVVANEVKALARQTAEATSEIRNRLNEMRTATEMTVGEIGEIYSVIREVDDINQEIARALEEQNNTTGEIARCVRSTTDAADNVSAAVEGRAGGVFA